MRREYVISVCQKYRSQYMKATRAFLAGETAGLEVKDMIKGIGQAIKDKFTRRRLVKQRNNLMKKFGSAINRRSAHANS